MASMQISSTTSCVSNPDPSTPLHSKFHSAFLGFSGFGFDDLIHVVLGRFVEGSRTDRCAHDVERAVKRSRLSACHRGQRIFLLKFARWRVSSNASIVPYSRRFDSDVNSQVLNWRAAVGVSDVYHTHETSHRGASLSSPVLQGYLAHKKPHPPMTLQQAYAEGPVVAWGGGAISYERGTPVFAQSASTRLQGYLAHKKTPPPLEPP
jgi:hypothetical protein